MAPSRYVSASLIFVLTVALLLQGQEWALACLATVCTIFIVYWLGYRHYQRVNLLIPMLLLLLAMPYNAPVWMGICAGALLVYLCYSGNRYRGRLLFNPVMGAWCLVLWVFPFAGDFATATATDADAMTSATPLAGKPIAVTWDEWILSQLQLQSAIAWRGLTPWSHELVQWSALVLGVILAVRKIIDWLIPASFLLSSTLLFVVASDSGMAPPFYYYWLSGGGVIAAFFTLTDPASGCQTRRARCVAAASAGLLLASLRIAYGIEAIAIAVVAGNFIGALFEPGVVRNALTQQLPDKSSTSSLTSSSPASSPKTSENQWRPLMLLGLVLTLGSVVLTTIPRPTASKSGTSGNVYTLSPTVQLEIAECQITLIDQQVKGYAGYTKLTWRVTGSEYDLKLVGAQAEREDKRAISDVQRFWDSQDSQDLDSKPVVSGATKTAQAWYRSYLQAKILLKSERAQLYIGNISNRGDCEQTR